METYHITTKVLTHVAVIDTYTSYSILAVETNNMVELLCNTQYCKYHSYLLHNEQFECIIVSLYPHIHDELGVH